MIGDWLEIWDRDIDAQDIMRQIHERMSRRDGDASIEGVGDPASIAQALWQEKLGVPTDGSSPEWISIWQRDCDIVPRTYVIGWRMPILGPIHAVIRRIINAEIRRYLLPMLEKQSYLNREMLRGLTDLARENARLRREIERLRGAER